jgi:hypothetical protein
MGIFHRHSLESFTCTADEIPGITLLSGIDIQTNQTALYDVTKMKCPSHDVYFNRNGDCPRYGCSESGKQLKSPNLKNVIITYTFCTTCKHYHVAAQDGEYKYRINQEWVKLRILTIKKQKEEQELERLLNINNPEWQVKQKENKENHVEPATEDVVKEYSALISKLQTSLRVAVGALNESLKNDGIWEALPAGMRRDLTKHYKARAAVYKPVDVEELLKAIHQKEAK